MIAGCHARDLAIANGKFTARGLGGRQAESGVACLRPSARRGIRTQSHAVGRRGARVVAQGDRTGRGIAGRRVVADGDAAGRRVGGRGLVCDRAGANGDAAAIRGRAIAYGRRIALQRLRVPPHGDRTGPARIRLQPPRKGIEACRCAEADRRRAVRSGGSPGTKCSASQRSRSRRTATHDSRIRSRAIGTKASGVSPT